MQLTPFNVGFFRTTHRLWRRAAKIPPPYLKLLHVSCNDETLHSYTLLEEDPKNIYILWHNS